MTSDSFRRGEEKARSEGAFYTKPVSALLLASLAIRPDTPPPRRAFDPACGAGVLLDAVRAVSPSTDTTGTEIDPEEAEIARAKGHRVVTLPYGRQRDGRMKAGALELLVQEIEEVERLWDDGVDLVIMNPPYTNAQKRYEDMTPEDKKAMQKREKEIKQAVTDGEYRRIGDDESNDPQLQLL